MKLIFSVLLGPSDRTSDRTHGCKINNMFIMMETKWEYQGDILQMQNLLTRKLMSFSMYGEF